MAPFASMGLQALASPREKCSIAVHLNWITQIRHLNHLETKQKSTLAVLFCCSNNALRANGNEPQLTY